MKRRKLSKSKQILLNLYQAYCGQMSSEFDFPRDPWTPERNNDIAAINARNLLISYGVVFEEDEILHEQESNYNDIVAAGLRHHG
jgi:hypothetical protein